MDWKVVLSTQDAFKSPKGIQHNIVESDDWKNKTTSCLYSFKKRVLK